MSDFNFQIENFMLYCTSKNLSIKTLRSYEQTLKLFSAYMQNEFDKVKSAHIRHYIKYLRERGKYTVTVSDKSVKVNFPYKREDYNKPISVTTIANYIRNIKVFFNYLYEVEREIRKNPVEAIENIKPSRKKKPLLSKEELLSVLGTFDIHKGNFDRRVRVLINQSVRQYCGNRGGSDGLLYFLLKGKMEW